MRQPKLPQTIPALFLERVKKILPASYDLRQCFIKRPYKFFRINTLKTNKQEIDGILKEQGVVFELVHEYAIKVADAFLEKLDPLVSGGKLYAQGLESMLAVTLLDPKPGQEVLDLCAAPGSKTTQIAALMNNEGTLIANEPVRSRFYRLKSVVQLLGAKVSLRSQDGRYFRSQQLFDRILVDAPCSSEGRFLWDEPKTYAYWSLRKIHEMAHKQKGLLLNASRLLKPGGVLVYATCTFGPEENEQVVDWFMQKTNGQFKLEQIKRVLPDPMMDGFFLAKITS